MELQVREINLYFALNIEQKDAYEFELTVMRRDHWDDEWRVADKMYPEPMMAQSEYEIDALIKYQLEEEVTQ